MSKQKDPAIVITELKAWAIILPPTRSRPRERMVIDPDFLDEKHAWHIALGWPSDLEIKHAKQNGARAVRAIITYEETIA